MRSKYWLLALFVTVAVIIYVIFIIMCPLSVIKLEGDLSFTTDYDATAKLCVPAAYTHTDGNIRGQYRLNGKVYGTRRFRTVVNVYQDKIEISRQWKSPNGFQQHILVWNGKEKKFKDPKKAKRRALCTTDSGLCIVTSRYPITMSEFALMLKPHYQNAVNLDMGDFGFGWYKYHIFSAYAFYNRHKQTNWLTIKE